MPSAPVLHKKTDAPETPGRRSTAQHVGSGVMTLLVAAAVAGFITAGVAVASGSWQASPVLSGSMEPELPTGGIVFTEKVPVDELAVGDVVMFHSPDEPDGQVVHRIIELQDTAQGPLIRTKGDANPDQDPWLLSPSEDTAWVAQGSVPYLGYPVVAMDSPEGQAALLGGAGLVVIGGGGVLLLGSRKRTENSDDPAVGVAPAAALAS